MKTLFNAVAFSAALILPALSYADLREVGRQTVETLSPAVITVEVVSEMKMNFGGREQTQENKAEALGTVVDATGVAVTALSSVDPTQMWERMAGPGNDYEFSASIKSIKYILADNTEVAARITLRDSDLDMAFLVPEEPAEESFAFVDISSEAVPLIFDEAFTVSRMGRISRRTPLIMSGEIQAVVEKPRPYYVPSSELASGGTGVPVFNQTGSLLGLIFLHSLPGSTGGDMSEDRVIPVVIPSADVREALKQIPRSDSDS